MSEPEASPKIRQLRKVEKLASPQPSAEIVEFLEEMLVAAKEGRVQSLVMGWRENEEMQTFMAGEMFGHANLHLQFVGLLESMKLSLLDEFADEDED